LERGNQATRQCRRIPRNSVPRDCSSLGTLFYGHQSGVYEIKCNSCPLKYIGQTGRNFKTRFKEHIHAIRTNKTTSEYAQHILETGHSYDNIENTLNILHHENKGPLMNTWEQLHIHRLTKDNIQLNDAYTDTNNPIFDLIITHYN
jgi:hypothetical protein